MAYQPDPVSLDWERPAGRLLGRALADPGHWHGARIPTRPAYADKERGGFRLTREQRAFQRALYRPMKTNERWSLMRDWGPDDLAGRVIKIKVVSKASAERAVNTRRARGPMWRNRGPAWADPQQRDW